MTIFVIRKNSFFYGDDYNHYEGSRIISYFTNRADAEVEQKRLEIEQARFATLWNEYTLWNNQYAFEPELTFLKELDAFVYACCQRHILHGKELVIELPEALQDDDVFEFVQRAGMQKYDIFEFIDVDEVVFYAIWVSREQNWLIKNKETGEYLIYEQSIEKLFESLQDGYFVSFSENDFIYQGTLEDISETPTLLKNVLENLQWIKYDEIQQCLIIKSYDGSAILKLNPLLKSPIFEVKTLSLTQVLEIEKQIADKAQQEHDAWEAEYRAELAKNKPASDH